MRVIGDKNQISEDVFDFMVSYLPFPQKSIRSELAKLFSISTYVVLLKSIRSCYFQRHLEIGNSGVLERCIVSETADLNVLNNGR